MKLSFFIIAFIFTISINSFSQLRLISNNKKGLFIEFYNESHDTAYFFNPSFFLNQRFKKGKILNSLRIDMYDIYKDTLVLYFTDTTLSKYNSIFSVMDEARKKAGLPTKKILPPEMHVRYKIRFTRKIKYKVLKIKYNYSFNREEFLEDHIGLPVKEIVL